MQLKFCLGTSEVPRKVSASLKDRKADREKRGRVSEHHESFERHHRSERGSTEPTERWQERMERNAIANRQKRMRSECRHGLSDIGYRLFEPSFKRVSQFI